MGTQLLTKNTACLIQRMTAHAAADEIIQGTGWEAGKGCFVGCCLHEYRHGRFPLELGWPEDLAYLCDGIFESLSNADAKQFAVDVPLAVGVDNKDLSMVVPQFLFWMLSDPTHGSIVDAIHEDTKRFVNAVIAIFEEWTRTRQRPADDSPLARDARDAWAARDARDARAAWDARDARAAWDARDARAAWDARDARDARAAWDAWAARAAWDAWAARAARNKFAASKLIELLKAAPVVQPEQVSA